MRAAHLPDHAGDLRRRLADPRRLCEVLGLLDGAKPQLGGLLIRCPWHAERTASCSVRVAADGTIGIRCFGCDATGDALDLIAVVNGLTTDSDFSRVKELAAELAGTTLDADLPPPPPRQAPPAPTRDYPLQGEVAALWESGRPVSDDPLVAPWLRSRDLDPGTIETRDLARALPVDDALPRWARSRWGSWVESGHRLLVPVFDELGRLRSVRARRVVARDDAPKALPPSGHRVSGLIMADALARQLLERGSLPDFWPKGIELQIAILEGEPDYLRWATSWPEEHLTAPGIFAIVAGSWTPQIAARIPNRADVSILVHHDAAGEKYTDTIVASIRGRVTLRRGEP
ncbi:MAG TPA: CHC2 zinc finger domain-containing protein [Polyangia bacterium]|nr:CHC2 zinc finger domain-containing protein [Polyangia bacterium]